MSVAAGGVGAGGVAGGVGDVAARVAAEAAAVERRVLERLRRWVEHETPSGDEARCLALAEAIAAELEAAGAGVDRVPAPGWGEHLVARFAGRESELEPVVILGHLDTVHPVGTLARQPFRVVEGRVEGPGTYDMKAGLVVVVEALALLAEAGTRPRRPVRLVVTCDEEAGSGTSRGLIEATAAGAAAVLVPEPPLAGGAAKTSRKGVADYRLRALGRAAHAGVEPERGVNAILELAHQIVRVVALADPARGTTINTGVIAGGTAGNVVPAEAWVSIDVRFATQEEGWRVDAALRALEPVLPGSSLQLEGGVNRPPLERTEGVVRLYERARAIAAGLGWELGEGATGGGSDGSFTAALGIPTLDGLGVEGGGAHAADEHVRVADLTRRVAFFARLLETL